MYAFKDDDPEEFIAEAMSNKDFQNILQELNISPEMAKELGMSALRPVQRGLSLIRSAVV